MVSSRLLALAGLMFFVFVLWLVPISVAQAAPGDLDANFGTGGVLTGDIGKLNDVALQHDGKVVVVGATNPTCGEASGEYVCHGELLVEQYNSDGSLDTSFGGGDGIVTTSLGSNVQAAASSVLIESGGEILVGGTTTEYVSPEQIQRFVVARYQSNGDLDTSFGGGTGTVTAGVPDTYGVHSEPGSMALQSDGKIVLGGRAYTHEAGADPWRMVLARFTATGTLDSTYGSGGIALGPLGGIYDLTIDSSDRIDVAGWTNFEFSVARFTSGGVLDTSFAGTGLVHMDLNETGSKAGAVLVTPTGKILVSGYGTGMTVAKFNEDGSFDSSFGDGDGIATPTFGEPCCVSSSAIALALQPDGRIVIAGQWEPIEFKSEWAVARLYQNGMPDTSFGSHGLTSNAFEGGGYEDYANGVALQSDGKIVLIGNSGSAKYPDEYFGIMRFLAGGSAPQPAEQRLTIQNLDADKGSVSAQELFCGYNCEAGYETGETIQVTASGKYVLEGSEWKQEPFAGWTTISGNPGTCTGTTTPCEVMMNDDVDLKATFGGGSPTQHTLTISKSGSGSGTVTSSPSGIDCGATCSHAFDEGTPIALTATPVGGSTFAGWSGGCSGTGTCELSLASDVEVTATFSPSSSEDGGGGGGGSTPPPSGGSTPPPGGGSGPTQVPHKHPLKCRKGFKKNTVKGKAKCVKVKKKAHHHKGTSA